MSGTSEDLREAMETAIIAEIKAMNFYSEIAGRIENPEGKKRFLQLSLDEKGHRDSLGRWYEKLFGTVPAPGVENESFAEIQGLSIREETGAMQALDIAIEAELKAHEFYKKQAGATVSAELKKFFLELAQIEMGHYNLLTAEKNSLAGGLYWFDFDSTSFLED